MRTALKIIWLVLTVAALSSLFMPGDAGIVAGGLLTFVFLPLSLAAFFLYTVLLALLGFLGWHPEGDTQWLVVNIALLLILSASGYVQWFSIFPHIANRVRQARDKQA